MACACCTEGNTTGECRPAPSIDRKSGAGLRARFEVRLLAARFAAAFVLFALGLVLTLLPGRPGDSSAGLTLEVAGRVLFIVAWLVAGYTVILSAVRNCARGKVFDENFLMTVATVGAFIIGQWSEGAAVMLFFNLGEMIQESAVNRSRRSISDLMDVRPDRARLAEGDREVHPSAVPVGSVLRVLPGEKVPLDGLVLEGETTFDTSSLTGESLPREAGPGSEALAGFVNGSAAILVRTTSLFGETAASRMLALIEGAQERKAKAERLITSFARIYTPIVTISAVALAILPPFLIFASGGPAPSGWSAFQPWVSRALVFLVISCPCAFVISVPLGFFGGIGGAARLGILVKGADCLDALARTKAVVFDKTGTLTKGTLSVRGIFSAEGFDETRVISLAAAAERRSTHPVARAVCRHADALGIRTDTVLIGEYSERPGFGVRMLYDGSTVAAGSPRLMEELGIAIPAHPDGGDESGGAAGNGPETGTRIHVARDGQYAGFIVLDDEPKEDSIRAVEALRALGVSDVVMVSGDAEGPARAMARRLGIRDYRAGVLPHRKVEAFEEISARVKAASPRASAVFVGDGINDAPVLARSDVGIAMGGIGSDAAIEASDVVLMNDNPLLVSLAIRSARWTRRIVAENIALAFAVKLGFLALGTFGLASLWEAVFADVGVALLATANSLRARRMPRR